MSGHYVLDGQTPVLEPDLMTWARWSEGAHDERVVKRTCLGDGCYRVSTVFLASDHNFDGDGPPLLFKTMVFDERTGHAWDEQWRYATWDEAERGHDEVVRYAVAKLADSASVPEAPVSVFALVQRIFGGDGGEAT